MGYKDIKEISNAIGDMESAVPKPIQFIVLRHKDFSNTDGHQLFGLVGIRAIRQNSVSGGMYTAIVIDENKPCTFYHDRNNVQFAVIPDCEQNRRVLLTPNNVKQLLMTQQGERMPLLTVLEAPEDFKAELEKIKAAPIDKVKWAKLPSPKQQPDPFNFMPSDQKMVVEGESSSESFK